jgi:hypothetical protein
VGRDSYESQVGQVAIRLDPFGMLDVVGYRAEPGFAKTRNGESFGKYGQTVLKAEVNYGVLRTRKIERLRHEKNAFLRSSANNMLTRPLSDELRANFANDHCAMECRDSMRVLATLNTERPERDSRETSAVRMRVLPVRSKIATIAT